MKEYFGRRTARECYVAVVLNRNMVNSRPLPLRLDLCNHSPTGFEWGYDGSGPAQLALAILADALRDGQAARELHQAYKRAMIARLPKEEWVLNAEDVLAWVSEHLAGSCE